MPRRKVSRPATPTTPPRGRGRPPLSREEHWNRRCRKLEAAMAALDREEYQGAEAWVRGQRRHYRRLLAVEYHHAQQMGWLG